MRPRDFGDQYPSDADDVAPVSPTASLNEFDGPTIKSKEREIKTLYDFRSSVEHEQSLSEPRFAYQGWIVQPVNVDSIPQTYRVLTEAGHYVTAKFESMTYRERFDVGDSVTIIKSEEPDMWIITTRPQYVRDPYMQVMSTSDGPSLTPGSSTAVSCPGVPRDAHGNIMEYGVGVQFNGLGLSIIRRGFYFVVGYVTTERTNDPSGVSYVVVQLQQNGTTLVSGNISSTTVTQKGNTTTLMAGCYCEVGDSFRLFIQNASVNDEWKYLGNGQCGLSGLMMRPSPYLLDNDFGK